MGVTETGRPIDFASCEMQTFCLVHRSSSNGGGGLGLGQRKLLSFSWIGYGLRRGDPLVGGSGPGATAAALASGGSNQDHYAVLGIRRNAPAAEVKRAYRLLAREHHPDVSRYQRADEVFKKIRLAYEVLSDDVKRAKYDLTYDLPGEKGKSWRKWTLYPNYEKREEVRRQMQNRREKGKDASRSYQTEPHHDTISDERGPFIEVVRFTFFALFFMQTVGCRASLTLCGISALLDKQLDAGYKMGYVIAWILGGRAGILLTLCIYFASWLCGKSSSSNVALVVVALWVGASISRFAPLPQGALLTLLYMSMKLQVDDSK